MYLEIFHSLYSRALQHYTKGFRRCNESEHDEALYTLQCCSESNSVNMGGYQSAESGPSCCFSSVLLKKWFKNNYSRRVVPTYVSQCVCVCPLSGGASALSLICSPLKTAWGGWMFWIMLHSKAPLVITFQKTRAKCERRWLQPFLLLFALNCEMPHDGKSKGT